MKDKKPVLRKDITTAPVPALFQTNRPPSDDEVAKIKLAITRAEGEIEHLCDLWVWNVELAEREQKAVDSLRRQYEAFITKHQGLLSPVRRLPTEMLLLVFEQFRLENEGFALHHRRPPWILGQVCRWWRAASLSMAGLWRHFPPIYVAWPRKSPQTGAMVTELLARSKTEPITFLLAYSEPWDTTNAKRSPVMHALLAHVARWERVYLRCAEYTEALCELFRLGGRMDALRALTFDAAGLDEHPGSTTLDLFAAAPLLQAFTFIGTRTFDHIVFMPLNQLTHFEASDIGNIAQLLVALGSVNSLTSLVLRTHRRQHDVLMTASFGSLGHTTLPSLETLVLECYQTRDEEYLMALMPKLHVPSLKHLTVRFFPQWKCTDSLISMLGQSGCRLSSFVGHYRPNLLIAPEEFISVPICHRDSRRAFADLVYLRVNDPDDFILNYVLCCSDEASQWAYLPSLKRVVLDITFDRSRKNGHEQHAGVWKAAKKRCIRLRSGNATLVTDFEVSATPAMHTWYLQMCDGAANVSPVYDLLSRCRTQYDALIRTFSCAPGIEPTASERKAFYKAIENLVSRLERLEFDEHNIPVFYYAGIDHLLCRMIFEQQHWLSAVDEGFLRRRIRDIVARWNEVLYLHHSSSSKNEFRWQWNTQGNLAFVIKDSTSIVPPPTRFLSVMVDIAKQRTSFESVADYHWVQALSSYE
ncbi:hypothetical protein D9619_011698 [Psilocybe cf. subviscida]|uniref:F-box domain-containing protein n=1 Tax=Psilocybe cf. subviscida TaxID=2480587 RepID=A0A8H5BSV1_9AGAR|nr:hypothetical protein D9619_011698 [Psilocybe cf. subviscida]